MTAAVLTRLPASWAGVRTTGAAVVAWMMVTTLLEPLVSLLASPELLLESPFRLLAIWSKILGPREKVVEARSCAASAAMATTSTPATIRGKGAGIWNQL